MDAASGGAESSRGPAIQQVRQRCGWPEPDERRRSRDSAGAADAFCLLDEVLDAGLFELGPALEIVRANAWWRRLGEGFQPEGLVGLRLDEVVADDEGDLATRVQEWSAGPARELVLELRVMATGAVPVWVEVTMRRSPTVGLPAGCYLAVARDITRARRERDESRAALERERELNTLKSTFVTMVSHEFRNPLTAIVCATEVLQLQAEAEIEPDPSATREYLKSIIKASNRMCRLMDELLLLGRIESGALRFNPVEISPMELCEAFRRDVGATDRQARIDIRSALPAGETAALDPSLLRHTLLNLMTNALKYSPPDQPVTVNVWGEGEQICFEVRDRGIGIPEKDQERMFRAFFRASNVGSVQGTGVGLNIASQCARLQGGQLAFRSVAGQGTTFTLRLPRRSVVRPPSYLHRSGTSPMLVAHS